MRIRPFLFLLLLYPMSLPAMTGNKLLVLCNGPHTHECVGYIVGIHDARFLLEPAEATSDYCLPRRVSIEQLRRVVLRYLKERPESLRLNAAGPRSDGVR